jgi:hypothetical protein
MAPKNKKQADLEVGDAVGVVVNCRAVIGEVAGFKQRPKRAAIILVRVPDSELLLERAGFEIYNPDPDWASRFNASKDQAAVWTKVLAREATLRKLVPRAREPASWISVLAGRQGASRFGGGTSPTVTGIDGDTLLLLCCRADQAEELERHVAYLGYLAAHLAETKGELSDAMEWVRHNFPSLAPRGGAM